MEELIDAGLGGVDIIHFMDYASSMTWTIVPSMAEREKTASPLELQVLALSVKERKGREIGKLIAAETGQAPKWSTLYLTIERLAERGWVTTRQGEVDGRQVRWVKLNKAGTKALNSARQYYTELGRFGARPEFER